LRSHPQVFFSEPKEPHYFAADMNRHRYVTEYHEYLNLFKQANKNHSVIAEASVCYLLSLVALEKIKLFNPDANLIVMLRSPIEMAQSVHRQLLYASYEDEPDFAKAWHLQSSRLSGYNIPKTCREPKLLQYYEVCRLGFQLERLQNIFPQDQVKIVMFDDFVANTEKTYSDVIDFLGLVNDGRKVFNKINEAKHPRYQWLADYIAYAKPIIINHAIKFRNLTGINIQPFLKKVQMLNESKAEKQQLSKELHQELVLTFRSDIE
jgi:hypothetical protein